MRHNCKAGIYQIIPTLDTNSIQLQVVLTGDAALASKHARWATCQTINGIELLLVIQSQLLSDLTALILYLAFASGEIEAPV